MFSSLKNAILDRTNRPREDQERVNEDKQDFVLVDRSFHQAEDSAAGEEPAGDDTPKVSISTDESDTFGYSLTPAETIHCNSDVKEWKLVRCDFLDATNHQARTRRSELKLY